MFIAIWLPHVDNEKRKILYNFKVNNKEHTPFYAKSIVNIDTNFI